MATTEREQGSPAARRVTLIFTNSYDLAVNRLVRRLGGDRVFRFNVDLWPDYAIRIDEGDFLIENPTGRTVGRGDVAKLYWRKPISRFRLKGHADPAANTWRRRVADLVWRRGTARTGPTPVERYLEEEIHYAVREIKNLLWNDGKVVLVEPAAYMRLGKLVQMERAGKYFDVPPYEFALNQKRPAHLARKRVVKSLTSERVGEETFLWTTPVDEGTLDPASPWFVQDLIEAKLDVTVACVRGRAFAFALDRSSFRGQTLDWREVGEQTTPLWGPYALPSEIEDNVLTYMHDVKLDYGRLDFLYDGARYWFLEVNANGEWDWLDPYGTAGVLEAIVAELDPDTPVHPIPISAPMPS